jgi:uncharacterized membrane protein YozB (DUF420 family)
MDEAMAPASRTHLELLGLTVLAMVAALLGSLPLVSLVGALAVVVRAHSRAKRRAADAAALGAGAVVAFFALATGLHLDQRYLYLAPLVGGLTTVIARNRLVRRRRRRSGGSTASPPLRVDHDTL